jgi:LytR cell envelope-related transcriptional attenuator
MPSDATVSRVRRSPPRPAVVVAGAVAACAIVAILAFAVLGLGDSGTSSAKTSSVSTGTSHAGKHDSQTSARHHAVHTATVGPAETQVAVINGTGTAGLAHRLAASLQQSGYSQATPLDGVPPGTRQTTVVQYTSGHRAEASSVARSLGVSQVQPIEASVAPLVGSSTVVVVAGLNSATTAGATEASGGAPEATAGSTSEEAVGGGASESAAGAEAPPSSSNEAAP